MLLALIIVAVGSLAFFGGFALLVRHTPVDDGEVFPHVEAKSAVPQLEPDDIVIDDLIRNGPYKDNRSYLTRLVERMDLEP